MKTHPRSKHRRAVPRDARLAAVLGALSALLPLSIDMYLPCFDAMAETLGVKSSDVAWSLPVFFAGLFVGQIVWGPISDRFGRRQPMLLGLFGFLCCSLLCGCATSLWMLMVARTAQAFFGAAGLVISRAMVRDCFVGAEAVRMVATMMLVQGLAPMVGPTLGGLVLSALGWQSVFLLLAATGALLLWTCWAFVAETHPGEARPLSVRRILSRYGSLLGDRAFMRFALSGSVVGSSLFVYLTFAPFVMVDLLHLSASGFGFAFGAIAFCLWLVGQSNRYFVRHHRPETLLRAGLGITSAMGLVMVAGAWPTFRPAIFVPGLLLYMCGLPVIWPNVSTGALASQGHRAGSAAATQGALQWGLATVASLAASHWHDGTARPVALLMASASLLGTLCYVTLSRAGRPRRVLVVRH